MSTRQFQMTDSRHLANTSALHHKLHYKLTADFLERIYGLEFQISVSEPMKSLMLYNGHPLRICENCVKNVFMYGNSLLRIDTPFSSPNTVSACSS